MSTGWSEGDPVLGQSCPKCRRKTVVYNGNYWCTACDWIHDPENPNTEIINAYLDQKGLE